jgi:hypothetical protein
VDDNELITAFEDCTLPPELFSHRQHVRVGWIYLSEGTLLEALPRFVTSLKRYATSLGASTKYHETITFAFLFLIHERMQRTPAATWDEFAQANPDLFEPILDRYYTPDTLRSDLARATFVMPDRPLPSVL